MTLSNFFTTLANGIREKTGKSDSIPAQDLPSAIRGLNVSKKVKSASGGGSVSAYSGSSRNRVSFSFSIYSVSDYNGAVELVLYCRFNDSAGGGTNEYVTVIIS